MPLNLIAGGTKYSDVAFGLRYAGDVCAGTVTTEPTDNLYYRRFAERNDVAAGVPKSKPPAIPEIVCAADCHGIFLNATHHSRSLL
jgi:hypothetical protein